MKLKERMKMVNASLQEVKTRNIGGIRGDSKVLSSVTRLYVAASRLDRIGMGLLRLGLVIVLVWIGGLKFAKYEAEGIVPLVSQSPLMSFFYRHPAPEYRQYINREGELNTANRAWNESNGTYVISHRLGIVIVLIGLLIALHPVLPQ